MSYTANAPGTIDGNALPSMSTTKQGAVPATGVPAGKVLKDDGTWAALSGGGDMLRSSNLSDVTSIATARGNILPTKTGNSLKILRVNSGETDYELVSLSVSSHANTHVTGGSDVISDVISDGNSGLMSGIDKTKLDGVANGATNNTGTVTSVTAGNGITQSGTSTINPTLDVVSHAGMNGSIGTVTVTADSIGVSLGTTGTTACAGNDSRLSDSRPPTGHNQTASTITDLTTAVLTVAPAETGTTIKTALGITTLSGSNTGDQTISDATITTTDIITNNVSTTKHGFFPKLPTPSGKYLKDDLTWGTPPAAVSLDIQDEGVSITTAPTIINFVGTGVTVTEPVTDQLLVTIPSGCPVSGPGSSQAFSVGDLTAKSVISTGPSGSSTNTALGNSAMMNNTGTMNVAIGSSALGTTASYSNCIAIGYNAQCSAYNQTVIGSNGTTTSTILPTGNLLVNTSTDNGTGAKLQVAGVITATDILLSKQVHNAAHTTTAAISITASMIEVNCDGDGDTDILTLPAGTDGQEINIFVKSAGSVTSSLQLNATFTDGSTSYLFGDNPVGRGMTLIYSTTATAGWTIIAMNNRDRSKITNYSVTAQSPVAATRTYLTGSQLKPPAGGFKIGTILQWVVQVTKTAAGTAAATLDIAFGTTGTITDTARVSFAKPAGTAVADVGTFAVTAVVRGPISASCIVAGVMDMSHNLAATGFLVIPNAIVQTNSSTFDITTAGMSCGLCLTTGASDAYTIQIVTAEATNV